MIELVRAAVDGGLPDHGFTPDTASDGAVAKALADDEDAERYSVVEYEAFEPGDVELPPGGDCPEILSGYPASLHPGSCLRLESAVLRMRCAGDILVDRKSVFQAHLARVRSREEVAAVQARLMSNKKIARATHNIMVS